MKIINAASDRNFQRVAELQRAARAALPVQQDYTPTPEELIILKKAAVKP
jgi:hypothetical protein